MLVFEIACSEDPVVAGAGGETYHRPAPPLVSLGTILLPVECRIHPRQKRRRHYLLPPVSLSVLIGRVTRHR